MVRDQYSTSVLQWYHWMFHCVTAVAVFLSSTTIALKSYGAQFRIFLKSSMKIAWWKRQGKAWKHCRHFKWHPTTIKKCEEKVNTEASSLPQERLNHALLTRCKQLWVKRWIKSISTWLLKQLGLKLNKKNCLQLAIKMDYKACLKGTIVIKSLIWDCQAMWAVMQRVAVKLRYPRDLQGKVLNSVEIGGWKTIFASCHLQFFGDAKISA